MTNEPDDFPDYPPEPGTETKVRYAKTRETQQGNEDSRIESHVWKVGDVIEGFKLEKELGSGGTSTVYRVCELETGRVFALKWLRSRSESVLAASRMGFRRMAALSHPSLVRLDRIVRHDEQIGFTMDEVVGQPLNHVILDCRHYDRAAVFEFARRLLHDVGGALQTIHNAGFVHRDVKPDNIMIDHRGRAKLIDYGIVGTYDPESDPDARRDYLAGTFWYMAPESISMQIYPPACDIYALGCILLELLAERSSIPNPIPGLSLVQSLGDVRAFLPVDTPTDLADLICDMIDPSTGNRPVAAKLVSVGAGTQIPSGKSSFKRTELFGRESEMAIAEKWVQSVPRNPPTRLHIYGESGVGKSWFLAELMRRIRANPWFQVFDAVCNERPDASLQVLDVMADAIARRYSRRDRDMIRLRPRHAEVLRQAFPVLRSVIAPPREENEGVGTHDPIAPPQESARANHESLSRSDALQSGVEFVDRMCDYGPLFLVIDDVQWADQDSINILDKVLSDAEKTTGIITIGRFAENRFRTPADCTIELGPLSESASIDLLREQLRPDETSWDVRGLKRIADLGAGNAYWLTQLAACINHDPDAGWQSRLIAESVQIHDILHDRLVSLSHDARTALDFLAIAGGSVRKIDLANVCDRHESWEDVITELVEKRLVRDDSARSHSVDIVHQRVGQWFASQLSPDQYRKLHKRWADYLIMHAQDRWRAARIAGHLIEAGDLQPAIPFIVQSAHDAEARFAFTESARWHHRASELLAGDESRIHLQSSISHFEEAGCFLDAAKLCEQWIRQYGSTPESTPDPVWLHRLASNLIRSGCFADAARCFRTMGDMMDPRGNDHQVEKGFPSVFSRFGVRSIHFAELVESTRNVKNSAPVKPNPENHPLPPVGRQRVSQATASLLTTLRLPMLSLLGIDAIALLATCQRVLRNSDDLQSQFRLVVQSAVLGSRKPSRRRKRMATILSDCLRLANDQELFASASDRERLAADASCGIAMRHLLACDWASAVGPAKRAVVVYQSLGTALRFDAAFAHLPLGWSYLWLGQIGELQSLNVQNKVQSLEQNDRFTTRVMHSGLGAIASLVNDEGFFKGSGREHTKLERDGVQSPIMELIRGFAVLLRCLYLDQPDRALRFHRVLVAGRRTDAVRQIQFFQILSLQLETLAHLRIAYAHPTDRNKSMQQVISLCDQLAGLSCPFAKAIAIFFQAQAREIMGEKNQCLALYQNAADAADSLDLVPFRLASIDRINRIQGDRQANELLRYLSLEGTKDPAKFARLYCGLC